MSMTKIMPGAISDDRFDIPAEWRNGIIISLPKKAICQNAALAWNNIVVVRPGKSLPDLC